jgi:hypothetical protein
VQRFRSHLSFANVVSVMALFVALGGASYAAVSLPRNSVGPKQIKRRAVRGRHINDNAVSGSKIQPDAITGDKVKDGSLGSFDILDNNLTAADLADGAVGAGELGANSVGPSELGANSVDSSKVKDGSIGAADLAPGAAGLPTITVQYEIEPSATGLADNTSKSYDVLCPAGQRAIGGGSRGDATDSEYTITTSSRPLRVGGGFPTDGQSFDGWRATVMNPSGNFPFSVPPPGGAIQPEVWAICAAP